MKRNIWILSSLLIVMVLAGCGRAEEVDNSSNEPAKTSERGSSASSTQSEPESDTSEEGSSKGIDKEGANTGETTQIASETSPTHPDSFTEGDNSRDDSSGILESPSSEGIPDSEISPDRAILREAVEEYYLALGAEEWYSTYDMLDPLSRERISREEWAAGNEERALGGLPVYHIMSIEELPESENTFDLALVVLSITQPGSTVTQHSAGFARIEGRWFRFLQTETISKFDNAPTEEQAPEPTTSESTESESYPPLGSDPNWMDRLEPF